MSNRCARCKKPMTEHPKGQCPDGGGSYTWNVPPLPQLIKNARRIRAAFVRAGHSTASIDESIAGLEHTLAKRERERDEALLAKARELRAGTTDPDEIAELDAMIAELEAEVAG